MLSTDHLRVLVSASRAGLAYVSDKVPAQNLLNITISIAEAEKYIEEESKPKDVIQKEQ